MDPVDSAFVPALARGAVAVGADGLLIEVHSRPEKALSDGKQSLRLEDFSRLMETLKKILPVFNRRF